MKKSVLYSLVGAGILILLAVGGYMILQGGTPKDEGAATLQPSQSSNDNADSSNAPKDSSLTIRYTDSGFEQASYEASRGEKVTIKNDSSMQLQFSSDEHPVHTDNPELNMTVLEPGGSDTLIPDTVGEWGIHDHLNPQHATTLRIIE